jgi:hypothetical protein
MISHQKESQKTINENNFFFLSSAQGHTFLQKIVFIGIAFDS